MNVIEVEIKYKGLFLTAIGDLGFIDSKPKWYSEMKFEAQSIQLERKELIDILSEVNLKEIEELISMSFNNK
tara:strand:- start:10 stop:225 length:216 start_codon:yes stop_codon:yes gene_type:complete